MAGAINMNDTGEVLVFGDLVDLVLQRLHASNSSQRACGHRQGLSVVESCAPTIHCVDRWKELL